MIMKPTDAAAEAPEVRFIVKVPLPGTTFLTHAVLSALRMIAKTIELVVQSEFVTVIEELLAAKFTVPLGLLIVCAPLVPVGVFVASMRYS